jgi:hypothetical protein
MPTRSTTLSWHSTPTTRRTWRCSPLPVAALESTAKLVLLVASTAPPKSRTLKATA